MVEQPNNRSTAQNPVGRFMVAVGAVIENADLQKILVLKRAESQDWQKNEWEIDYGRIDQFEDPEDGLRRELFEETGLTDISIKTILSVWHIYRGPVAVDNDLIGITYHTVTKEQKVVLSHEHSEYRWVTPDEALQLITVPGIRRDVELFIKQKKSERS